MHFVKTLTTALLAVYATATPITRDVAVDDKSLVARAGEKLSRTSLKKAMSDASEYIALRSEHYDLIVQGGAVNVVLGDRGETGDMDFIATTYTTGPEYGEILDKLKKAWNYATQEAAKRKDPIDSKWADNTIQFFFHGKPDLFKKYKDEAVSQNYVLSDAGIDPDDDDAGILFIAAPFDWQFVGKMVNVGSVENPNKPYDFADAGSYLSQWLKANDKTSIGFPAVQTWFPAWSQKTPDNLPALCEEVNKQAGSTLITGIAACGGTGLTARFDGPACNMTRTG